MVKSLSLILLLTIIFAISCNQNKNTPLETETQKPIADKKATHLEKHDDIRIDNYFWLNDKENPEVIDYLERENDYNDRMTSHTQDFQKRLFEEMKGRIKEEDASVPYKLNGYWYITRYEKGKDYPIYSRKKETLDAAEEILFDCNIEAEGHSYFKMTGLSVSPDNTLLAFGVDTVSRRKYTIRIKNLLTGDIYPETIETTSGGSTWAADSKTLFYTKKDQETLRSNKIFRHTLGTVASEDIEVFNEEDDTFNTFVYKTKSKKYIVIGSGSTLTSEYRILRADNPTGEFKIFQPRIRGLEYGIAHYENDFYVLTNADGAKNFKLVKVSEKTTFKENWEDLIPHRDDVLLEDIDIFKDYLVISERSNGLNKINIKRWDGSADYYLPFDNETYTAFVSTNPDFDTKILRYSYNALTTPNSVIDFNMETQEREVKKEQEVLGGVFNKDNYTSERVWATSEDGVMIPISLVYRKGMLKNSNNPVLQYAYGAYGSTIDPYFSTVRLSLLDRGFVYAIAHVRGGEYLGRPWYEDGKLFKKKNTFTDFIDCSKFLIAQGYTSNKHLYAMGGSAGGLLMGAIVNMAPELYNGVVAAVPFVDVVTTMLDDSIPLTTGEYDEWGNPNEKEYYEYMKSYSPYDNVVAQKYPNMLVTTGLHDSQVQYWEPAKWVAKLRELKLDTNLLLLHTNMDAGHGGASGRFEALKEVAEEYAFLLDLEGIKN
ncbi:S9 family peptidase [Aquimarina sp. RZ0]|uniref:S9 family peptidase n=1 Tax=Aquimarina sp. RZ0 TaxID=2607730 RepID=UPI0011F2DF97|nr:S9 family peptidase [Aquimarina sp. RZ0]KAA1246139.1 S9 family peptidase [Aquimarina sp. RZ0]